LAYFYSSAAGILIMLWVLLSFILPLVPFINFTVLVVTPFFTVLLLYLYFINIVGFILVPGGGHDYSIFYSYGIYFYWPIIEVSFMLSTIILFILLIPSRKILKLSRDEARIAFF
jgi:hypothetical protein